MSFPYWILKLFRLWRIFLFVFLFYWYIFWGTFKLISNYKLKYLSTSLSYDGQFQFHFVNRSRGLYPWNVGEIFMWQNGKMYFLFVFSWLLDTWNILKRNWKFWPIYCNILYYFCKETTNILENYATISWNIDINIHLHHKDKV